MFSQVFSDKIAEDGSRMIVTHTNLLGIMEGPQIFYGLYDYITPEDVDNYEIYLRLPPSYKKSISKGRKLLLKFEDDTIMELESNEFHSAQSIHHEDVRYNVKEEDLNKMLTVKVIRVRIENDINYGEVVGPKRFF